MTQDMKLKRPKYLNYEPGEFPSEAAPYDVLELKYDGWWGQLQLDRCVWRLFSRTGQLRKCGRLTREYRYTLMHGEFIFGTEWATDHPEYYGQLAIYGAECINNQDTRTVCNQAQRSMLANLLRELRDETIENGLFLVDQWPIERAREVWEANDEFEGLVFKSSTGVWGSPYGRMKRDVTMDYICMGFETSTSDRHENWGVASVLGGLIHPGETAPWRVCSVSGLTDDQRRDFYAHPEKYVGRVFEAGGKKLSKRGSLRHPNFVRWRDDKPVADCVWGSK